MSDDIGYTLCVVLLYVLRPRYAVSGTDEGITIDYSIGPNGVTTNGEQTSYLDIGVVGYKRAVLLRQQYYAPTAAVLIRGYAPTAGDDPFFGLYRVTFFPFNGLYRLAVHVTALSEGDYTLLIKHNGEYVRAYPHVVLRYEMSGTEVGYATTRSRATSTYRPILPSDLPGTSRYVPML
eukprot:2321186-Rhodomonas_salina.3